MSDLALTTRNRQRADAHRRIFEVAAAHLRVHGLAGTSIVSVAKAAGVSRQTFHDHVPTLEDVVAEALGDSRDRVAPGRVCDAGCMAFPTRSVLLTALGGFLLIESETPTARAPAPTTPSS